jgi:MFS transporter, putative metabolite:H+ symporter
VVISVSHMDSVARPAAPASAARSVLNAAVIVAALGYFVDIYDLVLFSVVRVASLRELGVPEAALADVGLRLLNWQMAGMLLGGIAFGILGDKKGRLQILFGSITLYSLATIANGFVSDLDYYAVLRFVAGVGLAGELGAGVTLVSEILPARLRGYGTMLVATIGVSGAIAANLVAREFAWRAAFFVGGGLGLLLLALRIGVRESRMFEGVKASNVSRGNFLSLFTRWSRFRRYLETIVVGIPTWFVVGILVTLSPEFAKVLGVQGKISAGDAVMYCYLGLVFGDFASGVLSQLIQSRKKVVILFLLLTAAAVTAYFTVGRGATAGTFYVICLLLGIASGYWAIFVTVGAEQFGTNLRATVATTVPNFVRGAVLLITNGYLLARGRFGVLPAGVVVGAACVGVALWAALSLRETFGVDLDYVETD